jgi:hypothetical protein
MRVAEEKLPWCRFVREYDAKGNIVKTVTVWSKSFLNENGVSYSTQENGVRLITKDPRFEE